MSTTYMTIHDLLRITYTYEAQAAEAGADARAHLRSRSNSHASICSVSLLHLLASGSDMATNSLQSPEVCSHLTSSALSSEFAALETDFTQQFANKKRDSCVSMA
ncbi:hypothetical protein BS50DRAFT_586433 [Corynespora cassiicola Philippines]|uniref:Uncharacterized protein n=1 Tax=Corynespora cassiicola Philippines TaxID=1448308 RepID=A0A2T2NUH9_CORCC|nr:hypothetical protein BS50DRAFT_586433 [Corynespora cassiicola Philippines]